MEGLPSSNQNRKVEDMSEVSENNKAPATPSAVDRLLEAQRRKREAAAAQHTKNKVQRAEDGTLRYWEKDDF